MVVSAALELYEEGEGGKMADGNVVGIKSIKDQIQLIGPVLFSSHCPDSSPERSRTSRVPPHQLFLGSLLGPADLTLEVLSVPVMKALYFLSSRASGSEVTQSFLFWRNNILSRVAPTRGSYNPWCCWHYHHCKVSPSLFLGNILSWDSTVHTFTDFFWVALFLHWVCIQEADVQGWDQTLQVGVGADVCTPLTLAYSRFSFFFSTS